MAGCVWPRKTRKLERDPVCSGSDCAFFRFSARHGGRFSFGGGSCGCSAMSSTEHLAGSRSACDEVHGRLCVVNGHAGVEAIPLSGCPPRNSPCSADLSCVNFPALRSSDMLRLLVSDCVARVLRATMRCAWLLATVALRTSALVRGLGHCRLL